MLGNARSAAKARIPGDFLSHGDRVPESQGTVFSLRVRVPKTHINKLLHDFKRGPALNVLTSVSKWTNSFLSVFISVAQKNYYYHKSSRRLFVLYERLKDSVIITTNITNTTLKKHILQKL